MKKYLSVFLAFILVSALFVSASALNMTSADQILAGSDGHDLAGFGGNNKDDTQLGFIEEDTFTAWGWYSTENEVGIYDFGYEYNNVVFYGFEKYYGEDADIIAQQCGGVGESVRFRVEIPVIGGEDVTVKVVARMNDGSYEDVWNITYSSDNDRTFDDIVEYSGLFETIDPDKLNIVVDGGLDFNYAQNGDIVDVHISLINNDIISSARLKVIWSNYMKLLNAEYEICNPNDRNALIHTPDVLDEYGDPDWSSVGNSYIFNWIAGNEKFFPTGDCTFVTLTFQIDKYCDIDFLSVTIDAIDEDDFYYTDGTDIYGIPVKLISGGIDVNYVEPYDPYKYVERDYEEIRDGVLNIIVDGALEKNEARAGDLVDIKVNLVNNTLGLSSLRGRVFWSDKLELVSAKYDIAEQGSTNYLVNEPDLNEDLEPAWDELDENAFVLNWVDFDETVYGDVTFATLTFRVKNNIGYNEFLPVCIDVDPVDVFYGLGHHVPFETLDGGVDTLVDIMPGDLDYNGKINNMDVLMLFRHLNDRLDRKVAFGTVDVNEDGSVNNKDVVRLFDMATALDR